MDRAELRVQTSWGERGPPHVQELNPGSQRLLPIQPRSCPSCQCEDTLCGRPLVWPGVSPSPSLAIPVASEVPAKSPGRNLATAPCDIVAPCRRHQGTSPGWGTCKSQGQSRACARVTLGHRALCVPDLTQSSPVTSPVRSPTCPPPTDCCGPGVSASCLAHSQDI